MLPAVVLTPAARPPHESLSRTGAQAHPEGARLCSSTLLGLNAPGTVLGTELDLRSLVLHGSLHLAGDGSRLTGREFLHAKLISATR